jgi:hypothetical protein
MVLTNEDKRARGGVMKVRAFVISPLCNISTTSSYILDSDVKLSVKSFEGAMYG